MRWGNRLEELTYGLRLRMGSPSPNGRKRGPKPTPHWPPRPDLAPLHIAPTPHYTNMAPFDYIQMDTAKYLNGRRSGPRLPSA